MKRGYPMGSRYVKRFFLLMLGTGTIFYIVHPLGNYLVKPVAEVSVVILSHFYRIRLYGGSIIGDGVIINIVPLCTPVIEWSLIGAYITLTWRGWKDIILLSLALPYLILFDSLRIALMFVLIKYGYSWTVYHDLNSYVTFLLAIILMLFIRERFNGESH